MSPHQARLAAMRNNMKRHLVGKSYAEIHTELAMRADSHREQVISLSSEHLGELKYTGSVQSACLGRIEHRLQRVGDKLKDIDRTLTYGIYLLAGLVIVRWALHFFTR